MEMVAAIEKEAGPIPIPRFFYDSGNMRFAANLATIQQLGLVAVPIPFEWDDKAENQSAPNQP